MLATVSVYLNAHTCMVIRPPYIKELGNSTAAHLEKVHIPESLYALK